MNNFEYYKNKMYEYAGRDDLCTFTKNYIKSIDCYETRCDICQVMFAEWCVEEYKEPEIDWTKVPVNTHVLVKESKDRPWNEKYFIAYIPEIRKFVVFEGLRSKEASKATTWEYCKLADEVDPIPYLKE